MCYSFRTSIISYTLGIAAAIFALCTRQIALGVLILFYCQIQFGEGIIWYGIDNKNQNINKIGTSFLQYALPRSGSSMIQQILRELPLEDYSYSHDFVENCDWPMISTLRDFRDVFISHWRIWHGKFDENKNLINTPTEIEIARILVTVHSKIKCVEYI